MTVRTVRLKTVADIVVSNVDKHSVEGEASVRLCNYVDVYKNTYIDSSLQFMESTASDEQIRRYGLRVGDVIITKDSESPSDIGVPALVTEEIPGLVCGYHLAVLRVDRDELNARFLLRVLQSRTTASYFTTSANGITRYGLTYYSLKNVPVPVPTLPKQQQIADFLDRETAEADALVAKHERLIELLEEKRIALITQAVTKGLDASVAMKDSKVAWIGEIPAHWKLQRISRVFRTIGSGTTPPASEAEWYGGDTPFVTTAELRENLVVESARSVSARALEQFSALKIYPAGTILLAMYGATIGRSAILGMPATVNQACCALGRSSVLSAEFAFKWFQAFRTEIVSLGVGGGQPNISQDLVRSILIPIPPLEEQKAINAYLDRKLQHIEGLRSQTNRAIALAKEHRSALITAAVTGQIDVKTYRSNPKSVEVPA